KGVVELNITQRQNTLFEFPLGVSIDHKLHKIYVKDKNTVVHFPITAKPSAVVVDPDVNLLAGFEQVQIN
ncbi:MAG TPA: hypothetical protein DCO83_00510, partial [Mucilaginibacter sp.]|nr:hypothetical protein [Mucilaginibacter sp.]